MNDLSLALLAMQRSRDFWQLQHQRRCDELAKARAELERFSTNDGSDNKEVITVSGYAID